LDQRRCKIEGVENHTQKMVREWKEKRKQMGWNGDWSVNEGYMGETSVGKDGKTYATMGMVMA
jgi:hypothetical protein